MFKYFFAFLAGAAVVIGAVIPFFAPAEQITWLRWRIPILAFAVIAVVALAIQLRLQYREDKENKKQQEERDKRFENLMSLRLASKDGKPQINGNELRAKVVQLGHDLFAFLREKGPRPEPAINHLRSSIEKWDALMKARGPYVEGIHYGYLGRFKQRTIDLFNELGERGIHDPEIEQWEIDPPQAVRADTVRKIAEHLFLIAARMDINDASKDS